MNVDLLRLKNLLADKPVFYSGETKYFIKGNPLKFENEEARERAKQTIQHFINRVIKI